MPARTQGSIYQYRKGEREGTGGSVQRPRHGTAAATAPVDLPAYALYMQMCTQVRRYIFVWPNPDSPPWPRMVSHNTYWVRLCALGQKWAAAADSKQLTRKICTAFSAETIAITPSPAHSSWHVVSMDSKEKLFPSLASSITSCHPSCVYVPAISVGPHPSPTLIRLRITQPRGCAAPRPSPGGKHIMSWHDIFTPCPAPSPGMRRKS